MRIKCLPLAASFAFSVLAAGCTDSTTPGSEVVAAPANTSARTAPRYTGRQEPRPGQTIMLSRRDAVGSDAEYRFRMIGSETGPTTLFLVLNDPKREKETEYFIDRCTSIDTDEFLPEGLLMPVLCDGRRIVLDAEDGAFVVRGGARQVRVPMSS